MLVVAENYHTGFDQPNLCGMYADKKLAGVNAVQTLSRLNRAAPGKEEVYVLDLANTGDEVRAAFEPFYGQTEGAPTHPNVLFDAAEELRSFGVIGDAELEQFRRRWWELVEVEEDRRHALLSTSTQGAYDCAAALDAEQRGELRDALNRFVRFYGFLAQVVPYVPPEIEVLLQFSKVLLKRLLSRAPDGGVNLSGAREDFARHRDDLLIGAAMEVGDDREKQGKLLKALLDDEDFRARAGELVTGSLYDGYRAEAG